MEEMIKITKIIKVAVDPSYIFQVSVLKDDRQRRMLDKNRNYECISVCSMMLFFVLTVENSAFSAGLSVSPHFDRKK